jgi:hypothetical protein
MCKHGNVFSLLVLMDESLTTDILHSAISLMGCRRVKMDQVEK